MTPSPIFRFVERTHPLEAAYPTHGWPKIQVLQQWWHRFSIRDGEWRDVPTCPETDPPFLGDYHVQLPHP